MLVLLITLGNPAHPEENKAVAGMLPLCVDQPSGIKVLTGDTLIDLSLRMTKPATISNSEWIDLIYEKNQDLFIDHDRNRLPVGEILSFPCSEIEPVIEEQPDSTGDSMIASLVSKTQEMEAALIQIKRFVEMQSEEIRRLAETQTEALNARAARFGFFTTAVLGWAGLISLLFVVLIVCLYRWSRALSATAGQTPSELEKIKQILPAISAKLEKAESRILQRLSHDEAGDGASDGAALRDYLKRLIPVDIAIDDFMQGSDSESEALKVLKSLVKNVFNSCRVDTFAPKIGEDYRRAEGVSDYPKTRATDKPEDNFKIAEVLEKGYRIKTAEGSRYNLPCKSPYIHHKSRGNINAFIRWYRSGHHIFGSRKN